MSNRRDSDDDEDNFDDEFGQFSESEDEDEAEQLQTESLNEVSVIERIKANIPDELFEIMQNLVDDNKLEVNLQPSNEPRHFMKVKKNAHFIYATEPLEEHENASDADIIIEYACGRSGWTHEPSELVTIRLGNLFLGFEDKMLAMISRDGGIEGNKKYDMISNKSPREYGEEATQKYLRYLVDLIDKFKSDDNDDPADSASPSSPKAF